MRYRTTNGNSNTVFRAVKESIRTDDAARHYGVKISKGGMARCIQYEPWNNHSRGEQKAGAVI